MGLAALLSATGLVVACGDDPAPNNNNSFAGSSSSGTSNNGGVAGSSTPIGGTGFGAGSDGGGTGGMAGTDAGGMGGTTAGAAGTATAGTGGTTPALKLASVLVDNVRLRLKTEAEGGAGGAGGADNGSGGSPDGTAGASDASGGAAMGGDGAGGAPVGPVGPVIEPGHDFTLPFDANLGTFAKHADGFSPGAGDSGGPPIYDLSTVIWETAGGNPTGAAKISVPFSVATQQADFGAAFAAPVNLYGYELVADVKLLDKGELATECISAWMYVYGTGGYANDKSGEPASGQTQHLVKDQWQTVRLDLDGPYGYHSTKNHPNFKPQGMMIWGVHLNTWGCP